MKTIRIGLSTLSVLLLTGFSSPLALSQKPAAAPNFPDLFASASWQSGQPGNLKKPSVTTTGGPNNSPFYQLNVSKNGKANDLVLQASVNESVEADSSMHLLFYARSKTKSRIYVSYQPTKNDGRKIWDTRIDLFPTWDTQPYHFLFLAPASKEGEYSVHFDLGENKGNVDIAKLQLIDTGPNKQALVIRRKLVSKSIEHRIDIERRGNLIVVVKNKSGQPVPKAQVKVEQTRHDFKFGCGSEALLKSDANKARFANIFNFAALPLAWNQLQPTEKSSQFQEVDSLVKWCKTQKIDLMGQGLISYQSYPKWAPAKGDAAAHLIETHIKEVVKHYSDAVLLWDIINDLTIDYFAEPQNGESAWLRSQSGKTNGKQVLRALTLVFSWAHDADNNKSAQFIYSTGDLRSAQSLMGEKQKYGTTLDGLGIKLENKLGGYEDVRDVWGKCEQTVPLNIPLYITKLSVPSGVGSGKSGQSTARGEEEQSEYALYVMHVLFSHPKVAGIIWSNFADGNPNSENPDGLLRRDGTPKPVYGKLADLIHKEWWTTAHGTTDVQGKYSVLAFYGEYAITVTDEHGKSVKAQANFKKSPKAEMTVTVNVD
jgi:endo-1,4-beta-xylanase